MSIENWKRCIAVLVVMVLSWFHPTVRYYISRGEFWWVVKIMSIRGIVFSTVFIIIPNAIEAIKKGRYR